MANLSISVQNIYLSGLYINNNIQLEANKELEVNIGQETTFVSNMQVGQFAISFKYIYKETQEEIFSIKVVTVFHLDGLLEMIKRKMDEGEAAFLPRETLITCLSLSLSHSRVYILQNIVSTRFHGIIPLPILNPTEIAKELYKQDLELNYAPVPHIVPQVKRNQRKGSTKNS